MLCLRNEVLRHPLGRTLDERDLSDESQQEHFGLIASESGALVACLCVKSISITCCKIRQMAVMECWRGKGLGRCLMLAVEKILAGRGARCIELHARVSVEKFYEKIGYKRTGKQFDEVGIPHIKMTKKLPYKNKTIDL